MSLEIFATFATLPKTERGRPIVINGDPKGKNMLYCNGNSVIIRNIEDPNDVDIYTQHSHPTTVARYAPSGFYIASGDAAGKIRIWDTTNEEHILKYDYQKLGGKIKDLCWSADSKRICVVGEGRDKFGHVFSWDTGTSTGEIFGQSKTLNQCDFKPDRPFRLVTVSEDFSVAFFEGPPFKYKFAKYDHTNFANCVRYAPNGETFTTAGADGKAFVYDGKTGEQIRELVGPNGKAHAAGVYAICYSPDSTQILTVSADKTAKIYEIESGSMVKEFVMGKELTDMQVGCLWQGDHLITVSLSGNINYLDQDNPTTPKRIIKGHSKHITALSKSEDGSKLFTGSFDGQIRCWDTATGQAEPISGKGHTNQIQDMRLVESQLITIAMDDTLRHIDTEKLEYRESLKLPSQPQGLDAVLGGLRVVACNNHVLLMRDLNIVFTENASYEPSSASIHPGLTEVAIGGKEDNKVHIYTISGDTLVAKQELEHAGSITDVKYSPDGAFLAACDTSKNVRLYSLPDYKCEVSSAWTTHTARVNSIAWTPDSKHLATGGLDCTVTVFDPVNKNKYIKHKGAHTMANISRVIWINDTRLVSVAYDSNVKIWNVTHKS